MENTIQTKLIDRMKSNAAKNIEDMKQELRKTGNYYFSYWEGWKNGEAYKGSDKEQIVQMFSAISGHDKESFQKSFDDAMAQYNTWRKENSLNSFIGSEREKEQLDYLMNTKDILFPS
jgi:hypothetical protein